MSDIAGIIGALAAALVPVGGGIAFVWNKIEAARRADDEKNEARFAHIEAQLEECHDRERLHQERRAVQLTVIELLWLEVKRLAPDAAVIDRAKRLLDGLKKEG